MNTTGQRCFFYFPPELLFFQSYRRVHSTEAKVEKCMSQVHFANFQYWGQRGAESVTKPGYVFTYSGTFMVYFSMKCNQGQSHHVSAIYVILARVLANRCDPGRRRVLLSSGVLNKGFASCSNHLSSHYHESLPLLLPLRINNQRETQNKINL